MIHNVWARPLTLKGPDPSQAFVAKLKRRRFECMKWRKRTRPAGILARDCRAIIGVLNLHEEEHCLIDPEHSLHQLTSDELHRAIKEEAQYWRRCAKIRVAIEGDENMKLFHTHASHHLRK